jgi:hypothetical protein
LSVAVLCNGPTMFIDLIRGWLFAAASVYVCRCNEHGGLAIMWMLGIGL